MRWLDQASESVNHGERIAQAEDRVVRSPDDPAALRALGDACLRADRFARAREAYAALLDADPAGFDRWLELAETSMWANAPKEALIAAERGLRAGGPDDLHMWRGFAFRQLGLAPQANAAFLRALGCGDLDRPHLALKAVLRPLAERGDPAELLALCDRLEPLHGRSALVRGYRAAALSRLGRDAEARALVDLDRHVVWEPIAPPPGYADIAAFNRALAAEILAQPPATTADPGVEINYAADIGPALAVLQDVVRSRMEAFLARYDELALHHALPPPPPAARMRVGTTIIRDEGSNRQHIHPTGYLSSVYYVQVPQSVRAANDPRGSLQIGPCDQRTGGHRACWGERLIKPVEGWLALFPSHFFHDVIPPLTAEPRISVPMDLEPVWRA
ncbi:putative 2OG-Fe(II) oxygenase [Sphingomonas sp. G-3-2-10]|uniref:putative 2OG-Fe(II) oxygenase n=1 Tax=Sphingomonas sp. G-3-2-10 TaxID=2728838 RepID=UPI00146DD14F|nr:putative 2OG-Fe(II) oxygenase [Sphingomonas sp. G-3-2-10]NML04901.1 hypothetical protein [Sphingomonas sp. G-3-2-10]